MNGTPGLHVPSANDLSVAEPPAPAHQVTTQDDLEMDESGSMLETMEMVPIGRIEEVSKKELREEAARRRSVDRRPRNDDYYGNSNRW